MKPTILTIRGEYFDFTNPEDSEFGIEDIAHALSHICRFCGHTKRFYSVAQHSVIVSQIVAPEYALEGLLHDASEAFLGDVSSPLKSLLPEYKSLEHRIEPVVAARLGASWPMSQEVKRGDLVALVTEQRDLMNRTKHNELWTVTEGVEPLPGKIHPWFSWYAKWRFLRRYRELTQPVPLREAVFE